MTADDPGKAAGLWGRVLTVDATTNTVSRADLGREILRQYLGGSYLGTYLWLENSRLEVDPFSAVNSLVIAPGLLTGYPVIAAIATTSGVQRSMSGM